MEAKLARSGWIEDVRAHLAVATVGGSTLMSQSGKGRVERARSFLLLKMPLDGLAGLDSAGFARVLDQKTLLLAKQLPRIEDAVPNWGAARKLLNIYLRMCAMNKDLHPAFTLEALEPHLEVPLDRQIVAKLDSDSGTTHIKAFKIKSLTPGFSSQLQANALRVASAKGCHRYELDVLYWNQ